CRACAATYWQSSDAPRRRARSSSARHHSPRTRASASCCSAAPRRAHGCSHRSIRMIGAMRITRSRARFLVALASGVVLLSGCGVTTGAPAALRAPPATPAPPVVSATAAPPATVVPWPDLPSAWRIVAPAPMDDLARYYREAEADFGVPWSYLAAIHLVETRMGRIRGTSVAGAQGPMQFMPGTWAAYGEGDVNSDRDAIRAAARYLKANGAPANMPNALFRYNNSQRYVRAVTAYAEVMRAEPNAYRGYYNWQVYYLTTKGDILLPVGYGS